MTARSELMDTIAAAYHTEARIRTPVDTGYMRSSWRVLGQEEDTYHRVLHNSAPYSGHVLRRAGSAEGLRRLFGVQSR